MDPFFPIELKVLRRVDQIEAGYPADHPCSEDDRREFQPRALRYPCSGRRDSKSKSEKEVGRAREVFRDRIKENNRERDRSQPSGQGIDRRTEAEEPGGRNDERNRRRCFTDEPVPSSRSRISLID